MKRFFRSLQAKYMFIILIALSLTFLIQILIVNIGLFLAATIEEKNVQTEEAIDYDLIEENWHEEANSLQNVSGEKIEQHFRIWKQKYPESSMFWVDGDGRLSEQLGVKEKLPSEWTSSFTAKFIKNRYGEDPFTVIAFVGKDEADGFVVLEMPRTLFDPPLQKIYERYGTALFIGMLAIVLLFVIVSFLFFRGIRNRLLNLQEAMTVRGVDGLPTQIDVKKEDEVGQLEQTFNQMVDELRESKRREQEEEQLRRELIANLSHDLRTPLTKISAQTYSLAKADVTPEVKQTVKALEMSIRDIDRLMENLMSYTLLAASKYKYSPKEIDVIRFVRESLASWYPVLEKEEFEIEIELQSLKEHIWVVDPVWLGRILDNLLQNVIRHAKSGQYIKVKTESTNHYDAFVIIDRGRGMKNVSQEKGAGIGLSIVDMMVKGMKLDWDIESSEHGTTIKIKNYT